MIYESSSDDENIKHKLYSLFNFIYILQFSSWYFLIKSYPNIVRFLFKMDKTDILFNITSNLIFGVFGFFLWIVFSYLLLKHIFISLFAMESTFKYYKDRREEKIKNSINLTYSLGSEKADKIFIAVLSVICLLFCILSLLSNVRVNKEGIVYKRFFELSPKAYTWNQIESITLDLDIKQNKKETNLTPKFIIKTNDANIDIWNGFGMGMPETKEFIAFTEFYRQNTDNPDIKINFELTDEINQYLTKYTAGYQLNDIYEYLIQQK